MNQASRDAILQAAAKILAWEILEAAGYGRLRTHISVDKFNREFRSAARKWRATHQNLTKERSKRK